MTEITASESSFRVRVSSSAAAPHVGRTGEPGPARVRRFLLWAWFPREILHRGGTVTRDVERAYRDLQAAQDRSEW
ncbi:hypothetical protein [Microbacterium sp. 22242]|uniref:hypothetical protein n=1 Tax=Microbacterium sp. 22242 TaxID=3453896 RepID=UPI003F836B83